MAPYPYPDDFKGFFQQPSPLSSSNWSVEAAKQVDGFAAASLAESSRPTAMKEWIVGAIHSLRQREKNSNSLTVMGGSVLNNKIMCSSEYLSCAFMIAHSLADQLSAIEEQRGYEGGGAEQTFTQQQPHHSRRNQPWSSCIYVNCGMRTNDEQNEKSMINLGLGDDIEQVKVPHQDKRPAQELEDMQILDLDEDTSLLLDSNSEPIEYLNVKGAALRDDAVKGVSLTFDGKRVIYSLGLVFYELFSGRQVKVDANTLLDSPAPARPKSLPVDQSATATEREEHTLTRALSIPRDCGATGKQGLGSTLECIDATGGDDKLFGSAFNIDGKNDDGLKNISDIEQQNQGYPRKSKCYGSDSQLRKTFRTASSESISVEPLRSLGLPTALCDLISNMIESTNNGGDTRGVGDETYKSMTDVRDDLKMLMDSPNLYLRDIDIIHASKDGLQFESTPLYGREAELETLKESYHRSVLSSECEVAMICGTSGIGKSTLSREFAAYATARSGNGGAIFLSGIFLSGKFDKIQQAQPFHAISSAFDNYCSWLSLRDRMMVEKVSSALKEDIGKEVSSLVTMMPNLASILGNDFDCGKNDDNDNNAVDAQKRLRYLFCQFVEVISRCHEEPLILFLDDCQWIDAASVALLNEILIMSVASIKGRRFFFYCCCRDDEMSEAHPLSLMLSSVGNFGIKTTKILLTSISKDIVNKMVSATLSLLPRLTRPLSNIIHHKTKGSPFFIKQLMVDLNKQRLLYPSLIRRRWVWESDKIRDMEIPENVAIFITKSLNCLPSEVLSALCVLSCFGASAEVHLVQRLETEIMQPLIEQLDIAVAASILNKKEGEYHFLHDKLQEAAYTVICPEQRCLQHFRFGIALGNVAAREKDDKLLITAVSQINHGGPQAVIDGEQGVVVAMMNLDAGKKAMAMSDFFSAYSFFDHGISYLRRGHWVEHYEVTLELFNLAARCAFKNAEYDNLKILTGQIMRKAKCFEDKCQAISISITLLLMSGNVPEATKVIFDMLKNLGEELRRLTTPAVIQHHLDETKSKLAGLSDDSLLCYPLMTNPSKKIAMDLLLNLFEAFSVSGEKASLPIVPLKMIQISLKHGMSALSPVGFAQYGNYLALVRGEFEEGYHYVKLALSLMKQMPSRAHDGDIIYDSNHTRLLIEPMQSAVENYLEAYKAAMKNGATKNAMQCSFMYDVSSFWSGKKLDAVVESMKATMKQMKYHKNLVMLEIVLPLYRVALRLTGQSDTSPQQNQLTDVFGETRKEGDVGGKLTTLVLTAHFNGFYEALMFRDFEKARDSVEKFFAEQSQSTLTMSNPMFHRLLYCGLVSFWISREIKNDKKSKKSKKWIARGVEYKNEIDKLAISASAWNFQNKTYLLQAEEQFSLRNFEAAEALYDVAIMSSKEHKFVNEEALANELAGHFYLETGRRNRSLPYFSQAIEKYSEWGAVVKASTLAQYLADSDR